MRIWGFWEWVGNGGVGLAALIIAANAALKDAPELLALAPSFLMARWWSYIPLALVVTGMGILVMRALGWIGLKYIRTGLRLQFFGDHRVPHEVSSDNIVNWFAYYTRSVEFEFRDA